MRLSSEELGMNCFRRLGTVRTYVPIVFGMIKRALVALACEAFYDPVLVFIFPMNFHIGYGSNFYTNVLLIYLLRV